MGKQQSDCELYQLGDGQERGKISAKLRYSALYIAKEKPFLFPTLSFYFYFFNNSENTSERSAENCVLTMMVQVKVEVEQLIDCEE